MLNAFWFHFLLLQPMFMILVLDELSFHRQEIFTNFTSTWMFALIDLQSTCDKGARMTYDI